MSKKGENGIIGSSFDDFLEDQNIKDDVEALAVKRVLAWQIHKEMEEQGLTKTKMAELMETSRSQLDRLLDPNNDKVQLKTIQRAAAAVGKKLTINIEDQAA